MDETYDVDAEFKDLPTVLSKKRKRKEPEKSVLKKKSKAEEVSSDGEDSVKSSSHKIQNIKKSKSKSSSGVESQHGKFGIWIGNLPFSIKKVNLREFFSICGEITRVHMPKNKEGQNKGFAYVDFIDTEGRDKAIELSESEIGGRKVLIKDSRNFEGRPMDVIDDFNSKAAQPESVRGKSILSQQKHPPCPTVFVGNLGFEATIEKLKELFANEGVRKVRLGTFEDSGKCKGWAFIDFKDKEFATAAILDPKKYWLDGRKIRLEFGSEDAVRRGGMRINKPIKDKQDKMKIKKEFKQDEDRDRKEYKQDQNQVKPSKQDLNKVAVDIAYKAVEKVEMSKEKRWHTKEKSQRMTSGFALATAQRQKASIPNQPVGQKIVFD